MNLTPSQFNQLLDDHNKAAYRAAQALVGLEVRVTCPYYNGQCHGRSKKPLIGKIFKIQHVNVDRGRLSILLDHPYYGSSKPYVTFEEVELVGEPSVIPEIAL